MKWGEQNVSVWKRNGAVLYFPSFSQAAKHVDYIADVYDYQGRVLASSKRKGMYVVIYRKWFAKSSRQMDWEESRGLD